MPQPQPRPVWTARVNGEGSRINLQGLLTRKPPIRFRKDALRLVTVQGLQMALSR